MRFECIICRIAIDYEIDAPYQFYVRLMLKNSVYFDTEMSLNLFSFKVEFTLNFQFNVLDMAFVISHTSFEKLLYVSDKS